MSVQEEIELILRKELQPTYLEVENRSYLHEGHAGDNGSGQTHFYISIEALALKNKTRLEAHQKVYKCLNSLLEKKIHALEISIKR